MNRLLLSALALSLGLAPFVAAHDPAGTPKNYCEDPSEWDVHDYAPIGATGVIALGQDGNVVGDCDANGRPGDFDGHLEFTHGGAWLSVETGDGVTSGSLVCFGERAHHPILGPFRVRDVVLGATNFTVTADQINLQPPTDPTQRNCGDFESDHLAHCVAECFVTFLPGLDGTYQVYVGDVVAPRLGTAGHVSTSLPPGGSLPGP